MTQRKSYLVIALTCFAIAGVIFCMLIFQGCAWFSEPRLAHFPLTCVDHASASAHAYEHILKKPAEVCVGRIHKKSKELHAQARSVDTEKWIGIYDGYMYPDVSPQMYKFYYCLPVRQFDFKVKRK